MRNAHSPNQQNERLDTAILIDTQGSARKLRSNFQNRRDTFSGVYRKQATITFRTGGLCSREVRRLAAKVARKKAKLRGGQER